MAGTIFIGKQTGKGLYGTADPGGTAAFDMITDLQIAPSGFSYQTSDELQWTTFDLVSTATDEVFRQQVWQLDLLRDYALRWGSDATNSDPIYLYWNADGETPKRRSVVHDISWEINSEEVLNANLGKDAAKMRLAVQHDPFWEAGTTSTFAGTVSD